ncbi:MAG: hypothetical protein RL745_676 [Actinomycetota bacterium]
MAELQVSVVAADRQVWSGAATSLVAATSEGEIGILPGHEPVLAVLRTGVVRIKPVEGAEVRVAVDGGFFSVDRNVVRVLSGDAKLASEIDEAATRAELDQAKAAQDVDREKVLSAHLEALAGPRH